MRVECQPSDSGAKANERLLQGKVLIVEDDTLIGEWIQHKLERFGLNCLHVRTKQAALDALNAQVFHAVVTDVFLDEPLACGIELIHEISDRGLPVVVMSSRADLRIAREAVNSGALYLLEKPFPIEDLVSALQKLWEEPRGHVGILERFLDLNNLTTKEKEIVRLLLKGFSNREVAEISGNTEKTIKFHLTTIFQKCGVSSRTELFNAVFPT